MYEVNIKPEPHQFLDWDKPLPEQSSYVKEKLGFSVKTEGQIKKEATELFEKFGPYSNMPPEVKSKVDTLNSELERIAPNITGEDYYRGMGEDGGLQSILSGESNFSSRSAKLLSRDIPGIRYLDQGSRGVGEGTSNYVVFDDKLVDIVRKYGLAGMIGGGGAAAALTTSGAAEAAVPDVQACAARRPRNPRGNA